jgi:hypothetical protein
MLFAFFFLIDSLLIITYFKWRLLAADPAKHPNCIVTLSNKCWKLSQNVKVNGRQWWFKFKPWVDKNQLKYDTLVFLRLDKWDARRNHITPIQCPSPKSVLWRSCWKEFLQCLNCQGFGKMLEFCMWYGDFDKCVVLCLLHVQRNLHAISRQ